MQLLSIPRLHLIIQKFGFLLAIIIVMQSCKKNDSVIIPSGTYSGRYLWANGGIVYYHGELGSTITFNANNYSLRNYNTNPAANSVDITSAGTYSLRADSIIFTSNIIPPGTPQSSIQAKMGTYQYHFEGDSLIINYAYRSGELSVFNQYRLKRN